MASQLKVDTLTGVSTAGSIDVTGEGNSTTTNLQQGLCKMWINFDPDTIEDSFNVASHTDVATGQFRPIVTNAFSGTENRATVVAIQNNRSEPYVRHESTTDCRIYIYDEAGGAHFDEQYYMIGTGDLA
tara:strand:- start:1623 stop:2009 length:387 start_codon:yes stop_codon:yes gene_type:complete